MQNLFFRKHFFLVILVVASTTFYLIDYFILGNVRDIVSSFIGNLAFLPIYVIFVTVMIEQIMRERERQAVMGKLNMVIGVFFSEVGNRLLRELSSYVAVCDGLRRELRVTGQWKEADFRRALTYLKENDPVIECASCDKQHLKEFLSSKRSFLVSLLENQTLLEHDQFTELMWAVFHLVEELDARDSFENMPRSDIDHISGDIKRAFGYLSREWVHYMKHLQKDYPYLFSLAIRMNPMVENPDAHVY